MEKEEILEASRNDNKKKDLAGIEVETNAVKWSAFAVVILSTIYFAMEIMVKGKTNYGWYSIIALYNAVFYGYKAIKDKKKLHIFNTIIWAVVAIILIVVYVKDIFTTSTIL